MNTAQPLDLSALVGPAAWQRLPPAVQRRFATGHCAVIYRGSMDMRCSRIGRVLAWLVKPFGSPLVAANTRCVLTTVLVRPVGAGVEWERRFQNGLDSVCSTKELDAAGRLQERTRGGLGMALDVFELAGDLVFESRRYFLAVGGRRVAIPRWLSPGTCRVEHRDLGHGRFRFTLSMSHPLWGETFQQTGVFQDPTPHGTH